MLATVRVLCICLFAEAGVFAVVSNFPAGILPFSSVHYVTQPDLNGDSLVAGQTSSETSSLLASIPTPSVADEQFSEYVIELAPGRFFKGVYIPTSGERQGDFSRYGSLLIDPLTNAPFPGGIVPPDRLGSFFAFRVRAEVLPPSSKCDFDWDTHIGVPDLQVLVNSILGLRTCFPGCDINSDGSVNVLELQTLVNVILEKWACPPDTSGPELSSIAATEITVNGATIVWRTDEPATSQVEYGATATYGRASPLDSMLTTFHRVALSGLPSFTLQHYRVRSVDGAGNANQSGDLSFVSTSPGPSIVAPSQRRLLVQRRNPDGTLSAASPYTIRGVCWSPASRATDTSPSDPANAAKRRLEFGSWYLTDIPLMKAMNINTVRLFLDPGIDETSGAVGRAVLDELYRNDIMVIMTVDDAINDVARAERVVNYYKDHPAVLMWALGNEWNINRYYGVAATVLDAAQRTEHAAQLVKKIDANHPVVSSYGEIDIAASGLRLSDTQTYVNSICPSVDVWSLNLYRGNTFTDLWTQWAAISGKPVLIGEYGADAYDSIEGAVNEEAQAQWDLSLWNDLARHLSAQAADGIALGGAVFSWNDEWWKVSPAGTQQAGGWDSGGFPDGRGNEEYFGLVDIDRKPRSVCQVLTAAYDPSYVPPPPSRSGTFQAVSRGGELGYVGGYGYVRFYKDGTLLYSKTGGGGGGRGFNVAAIDPATGELREPVRNFDTWISRQSGSAMNQMIAFLNGLPDGTLVLIAVCDEAGLNNWPPQGCTDLPYSWVEQGTLVLEALGSARIRDYCYWDSWAVVAIKGQGTAIQERLQTGGEAGVQAFLTVP